MASASAVGRELRHRQHRTEDLLLEDAHLVVAFGDGRLHVVAVGKLAADVAAALAAGQHLGAFLTPMSM
jgi:hypothetical protein